MSNRFTNQLHQLEVIDPNEFHERFLWKELIDINYHIYFYLYQFDDWNENLQTDFAVNLSERWVLLGFIAAMSDEDIDELIINWEE